MLAAGRAVRAHGMRGVTAAAALVASLGGIGRLRPAPGTWGSLAVLPLAALPWWGCLLAGAAFTLAGFWALARLPAAADDPGWVVVDEAAGMALALALAPPTWWGVLMAFALFRLFDVRKPGPVGWLDRRHDALGVMGDDLAAGLMAGAIAWGMGAWT